jgi:hypothetical protein
MVRALVAASFLLLAVLFLWMAFVVGTDTTEGNLFINLGTEIIGIVITVAVVESFLERRRLQTRGRQLAWDTLHSAETAVWVWQGGPREMETDELLGVLDAVDAGDPLPDFTESLFLNLGTRSRRLLNNDPQAVDALPGFMSGLEQFARLSAIRDGRVPMAARKVADIMEEGVKAMAQCLGQPTERHLASLIRYRDPSVESQERRHYGGRGTSGGWRAPGSDLDA